MTGVLYIATDWIRLEQEGMSLMIVVRDQLVSYIKVLCFCVDLVVDILYLGMFSTLLYTLFAMHVCTI